MTEEWNITFKSVPCQIRKASTAEDFELQVRRLDEMGKAIDTLTTMLTKPPQPQGSATEKTTLMRSCSQTQELHVMRAPFIGNLLALRLVLYTQIKELLLTFSFVICSYSSILRFYQGERVLHD